MTTDTIPLQAETKSLHVEPLCAMGDDTLVIGAFVQGHISADAFRAALETELAKPISAFDLMDEGERTAALAGAAEHRYFREINDQETETVVYCPVPADHPEAYAVTVAWWED